MIRYSNVDGIAPGEPLTPEEEVVQRVFVRLRTHLGEWDQDTTVGMPWDRWLSEKPTPVAEIRDRTLREIQNTPGVLRVTRASVSRNGDQLVFNYRVRLVEDPDQLRVLSVAALPFSAFRVSFDAAQTVGV